jgi:hypothetical protein
MGIMGYYEWTNTIRHDDPMTNPERKRILSDWEDPVEISDLVETLQEMKERGYTQVGLDTQFLDQWDEKGSVYLIAT